jgi:hypothetical protein
MLIWIGMAFVEADTNNFGGEVAVVLPLIASTSYLLRRCHELVHVGTVICEPILPFGLAVLLRDA